ncbi:DUF4167 domain-containing protein [Bradyrhizobium sp. AZCC 1578]|uniref:DUF4167 domain-containing protein n=1 Tax=Bradyrhizobium sp. AZCC 1578 TaxID=3117027 RepID=UPI002FF4066C
MRRRSILQLPQWREEHSHGKAKSSGPASRGSLENAQRNYERYVELARAEALKGDLIAAENYLQHAEHYLRSMHEEAHGGRLSPQPAIVPKQRLGHSG